LVEPIKGAGAAFATNHYVDVEFLRVHRSSSAR
jgi:hypothetical protein